MRSRYPPGNRSCDYAQSSNATLKFRLDLRRNAGTLPKLREAALRVVSGKLLIVVKFYLNISYGLFYAKFSRQEEAVK
ncbi:hypothetical protein [Nostoc sp. MS1]|uniref:hypothetical protein n=1 Tax=Nostoc sp. MS1 TaxID=2764711 RepID=UPI001CC68E47|nr:hypothetical protein [Nostoc sp. MS1]